MKTPQQTLDEVAKEKGYEDWVHFTVSGLTSMNEEDTVTIHNNSLNYIIHESMRRYANGQKKIPTHDELYEIGKGEVAYDRQEAVIDKKSADMVLYFWLKGAEYAFGLSPPSWVSDEEIEKAVKLHFNRHTKGEHRVIIASAKLMRSLIFKEGKPQPQQELFGYVVGSDFYPATSPSISEDLKQKAICVFKEGKEDKIEFVRWCIEADVTACMDGSFYLPDRKSLVEYQVSGETLYQEFLKEHKEEKK